MDQLSAPLISGVGGRWDRLFGRRFHGLGGHRPTASSLDTKARHAAQQTGAACNGRRDCRRSDAAGSRRLKRKSNQLGGCFGASAMPIGGRREWRPSLGPRPMPTARIGRRLRAADGSLTRLSRGGDYLSPKPSVVREALLCPVPIGPSHCRGRSPSQTKRFVQERSRRSCPTLIALPF
jgi:hypothetical protein